jgi:hypothetical protein
MSRPLTDFEPQFLRHEIRDGREVHVDVDKLDDAQGVMFLCPVCSARNGGADAHGVLCWFRDCGVPDEAEPGPARWLVSGAGLGDLTLSPSVMLLSGCGWHGFITGGQVT